MTLSEVAAMFDKEVLQGLRKEFGGLQTLLRNQHQVFQGSVCMCVRRKEEAVKGISIALECCQCIQQHLLGLKNSIQGCLLQSTLLVSVSCVCMCVCICVCVCVCVCVCMCECVCVCVMLGSGLRYTSYMDCLYKHTMYVYSLVCTL